MSLIKVKDIGFGLTGNVLDITIAIPQNRYLVSFHVYNQNNIAGGSCSGIGTEYLNGSEESFHALFGESIGQETDPVTGQVYDIYTLIDNSDATRINIPVSQRDMTIISTQLTEEGTEDCSDSKLVVPLYNLTPMRLAALSEAKSIKDGCSVPRAFMDKVLQIKAIEVALCCQAYCEAAKFWKMFYEEGISKPIKKCGCHGGVA